MSHSNKKQKKDIPIEAANEALLGAPTIKVNHLFKSFGKNRVVNNLSLRMYENQIFALLGHNGAGKTTTINILTGMISPDSGSVGDVTIYGEHLGNQSGRARKSLGVCPQHDVLFEKLSIEEHIMFFAQLKGKSYEEAKSESDHLIDLFHLEHRRAHLGSELSGGQKRKLSVAIAVCGGSKFVVLDEPTAGMDPLARRELWDLLASLRKGRTMLLVTHYMDEADVLGDRIGIMTHGKMRCCGSSQFLKTRLGIGYRLIFDKDMSRFGVPGGNTVEQGINHLTDYVHRFIPEAQYLEEAGHDTVIMYTLPFSAIERFGQFFAALETQIETFPFVKQGFNVLITSLEDVFLKVGQDQSVTHHLVLSEEDTKNNVVGIGSDRDYSPTFLSQTIGIMSRRILYAWNDWFTIALLLLPVLTGIVSAILFANDLISSDTTVKNFSSLGICMAGYLGMPGLIAEFIVRERADKLRNVLNVMGCSYQAYWIGTFLADYLLLSISLVFLFICWGAAGMSDFINGSNGLNFFLWLLLFPFTLIAYSYAHSFLFSSPKTCLWSMLAVILFQVLLPSILILIIIQIASAVEGTISQNDRTNLIGWLNLICSPFFGIIVGSLNAVSESGSVTGLPSAGDAIGIMIAQTAVYFSIAYYIDIQNSTVVIPELHPQDVDEKAIVNTLEDDVREERRRTLTMVRGSRSKNSNNDLEANLVNNSDPLMMQRLRKVFPAKDKDEAPVVAVESLSFAVGKGEIFGLLGANGAGKTTALSLLTRLMLPSSGDAFVTGHSILTSFPKASTHLGVVTQNNSLWDRLTVQSHLYLFARLRGVPEDLVKGIVENTIEQLELAPHRDKLAMNLSGGMKRKLCVAIALIGDPEVVLLDEPSAGLDPVSRRNLWTVILRTMSNRSVILTTHSMEEAEALCRRIGVMVQGQLRALGSKVHLKNKYGSGFELTVKLEGKNIEAELKALTPFIVSLFPSSTVLAENGGLITYQIPKEEMKMSLIFQKLYEEKEKYSIEEFTVAQPTLEQVFIRILHQHTPANVLRYHT